MLPASASDNAANCPTVSMPRRRNFSSATGPIPQSLRTGRLSSSGNSSSRRITRMPSGLAISEAIFAICLPDPAPTEVTRPVSSRTRSRNCAQNCSTSAAVAPARWGGSPNASSKDSCSSTGTIARTVSITRWLATPYTAPRGGSTTTADPINRRAWCIGIAERAPKARAS